MKGKDLPKMNYFFLLAFIFFVVFSNISVIAQDKKENKSVSDNSGIQTNKTITDFNYYRDLFSDTWVTCDGVVIGTITPSSSTSFGLYYTSGFTVTAGTHRIKFEGIAAADNTAFIDKVSLVFGGDKRVSLSVKDSEKSDDAISIYPNPASDQFTLTNIQLNTEVSVFTLDGKKVYSVVQTVSQSPLVIKANSWSKGVYLVHVKTDTDNIVKKIIIQ